MHVRLVDYLFIWLIGHSVIVLIVHIYISFREEYKKNEKHYLHQIVDPKPGSEYLDNI